ncbi:MAG: hypothetical protein RML33_11210 [Acidobacteriota bacterium]|nr:hypothetical protein [Leptospiraceae bacterium]MDW8305389.1 hypothetical protein [Acidobacteriota bacterium]
MSKNKKSETAIKETTIVTRMKEEVPIEEIKAIEQLQQEAKEKKIEYEHEKGKIEVQKESEKEGKEEGKEETKERKEEKEETKTKENEQESEDQDDERSEIERIYDISVIEKIPLIAHVYRLPDYEVDQRTDARAKREKVGRIPFSLGIEDMIQNKFGAGAYLVELRTEDGRFFTRLSTPIQIAEIEKPQPVATTIPAQQSIDDKLIHVQEKVFNTMLKLVDKVNQDRPSELELFEKFITIQQAFKSQQQDEFTELAKEMLKKQILNPPEQIVTEDNGWAVLLAPAVAKLGEAIPVLATAFIEYFKSQSEKIKLEEEKIKAELIKQRQEIELLRLKGLEKQQKQQDQQNQQNQQKETQENMQTFLLQLIQACEKEEDVEQYAEKIVRLMNNQILKAQLLQLLELSPSELFDLVKPSLDKQKAENWIHKLQESIKQKLNY